MVDGKEINPPRFLFASVSASSLALLMSDGKLGVAGRLLPTLANLDRTRACKYEPRTRRFHTLAADGMDAMMIDVLASTHLV
jgi:hypothetical protein